MWPHNSIIIKATPTSYNGGPPNEQLVSTPLTVLVKCLQVELVLTLEDRFQFLQHFSYFHDKLCIKSLTVYPHKDLINSKLIAPVMRLLRGENYTSAKHISQVLNPTKVLLHHCNNMLS